MLDTAFVVGGRLTTEAISYKSSLIQLVNKVSTQYINGVILPICYGAGHYDGNNRNVLYYGATFEDRSQEMYSFFPCKRADKSVGFERYVLYDEKKKSGLGKIYTIQNFSFVPNDSFSFWSALKEDILSKGYMLGIKTVEPDFTEKSPL